MAVKYVAAGTFASGTGAITVTVPSGYQNDDLFLLFVESANQAIRTPSGWSILPDSPQGTGTAAAATRLSIFYKWVSGTQSSVSVDDAGDHTGGLIHCYRYVGPEEALPQRMGSHASAAAQKTGNQTITGGFSVTPNSLGTMSSFTLNPASGNYQYGTNNGAFTLTAPTSDCAVDLLVTNGASAGSITFSGFTVGSSTGDALTTTNGHKFIVSIRRIDGTSTYIIKALQ